MRGGVVGGKRVEASVVRAPFSAPPVYQVTGRNILKRGCLVRCRSSVHNGRTDRRVERVVCFGSAVGPPFVFYCLR